MPVNREVFGRVPLDGDILVSNSTATVVHELSILPAPSHVVCVNYSLALTQAGELARDRQVDAWLTADHTHFLKIASFRTDMSPRVPPAQPESPSPKRP